MWPLVLFAEVRDDPLMSPEIIWGVALLVAALLVGAVVIYAVDRWRKNAAATPGDADSTHALTDYRAMFENGEITEAEYAELRRRLADKAKKAPAPAPQPAPPAGTRPPLPPVPGAGAPPPNATLDPPPPPGTS
jgi:hypothetical protein